MGHLIAGVARPRVRQALVVFQSRQEVSERRAEELPWLLERLYNWTALRTVVLDLHMFDHLWSDRLKNDLLRYWGILSGAFATAVVLVYPLLGVLRHMKPLSCFSLVFSHLMTSGILVVCLLMILSFVVFAIH